MKTRVIGLFSAMAVALGAGNPLTSTSLATDEGRPPNWISDAQRKAKAQYEQLKASSPEVALYLASIEEMGTNYPGDNPFIPIEVKGTLSHTCAVSYAYQVTLAPSRRIDELDWKYHATLGDRGFLFGLEFSRAGSTNEAMAWRKNDTCMKFAIYPQSDPQIAKALFAIAGRLGWVQPKRAKETVANHHSGDS
jgi:hypothetical protein